MFNQFMQLQVVYVHKSKLDSSSDSFLIIASNGVRSKEATVQILVRSVDETLPTLILSSLDEEDSSHLSLFQSSSVVISDSVIKITDPDSPKGI